MYRYWVRIHGGNIGNKSLLPVIGIPYSGQYPNISNIHIVMIINIEMNK